ncbi:HD domain-containing phosphohydrolase [uncultured Desulfobacter sp.]|uniref:HD-GYP domain-containing protein n=1 Tax=uncultured Desulfobacter sp. TaxID=240139 RepID=UPI002AABCB3E|nr:HD domain-containing phosphohydrolase [uncultured Desulfobacter sp.]
MGLAPEYFDDGSSFFAVDPLSINPVSLTDFSLFERYPPKEGVYRFRCLLVDTGKITTTRLKVMLEHWDTVYIHKRELPAYKSYVKDNLEFILNHKAISVEKKTGILVNLSTDAIKETFAAPFVPQAKIGETVDNLEKLMSRALDFLSGIESLYGVASMIGHDYDTHTHSVKVGWLTAVFIKSNQDIFGNPDKEQLERLLLQATVAGCLHDLGKVKIPENVIHKPGRLNNLEYVLMQSHPAFGVALLFEKNLPKETVQAILYHHENEDGSGYPCGLTGDDIPLTAKLCHIADVFDALTSARPYKKAKTPLEALKIMAGQNPYLDKLKIFEAEAVKNARPPVTAVVRDDYELKLRRLRERQMLEEEAAKRVEARVKLRDHGMSHCFDRELLKRFIVTLSRSDSFDLSGLM